MSEGGRLTLVGTPLGHREDLSPRARRVLQEADLLLCEDTRSPSRLLGEHVPLPMRRSCFVANERERIELLLGALAEGKHVAFVSEAGLPIWSDPGRVLVEAAVGAGFEVDVVPGPTAATVALCLSGFDPRLARFYGFVARDGKARRADIERIAEEEGAAMIYEAGNRVPSLLRDLAEVAAIADREAIIGRELTKLHQEILRGSVGALSERIDHPLRGEVTVVIAGTGKRVEVDARALARETLDVLLDTELKPRERAKRLASLTGRTAQEIYAALQRSTARSSPGSAS